MSDENDFEIEYDRFGREILPNEEDDTDEIVFEFKIMYNSFEHDNPSDDERGWIMRRPDGSKYIRMTEFGTPYVANVSQLERRISRYKEYLSETEKAINLLSSDG